MPTIMGAAQSCFFVKFLGASARLAPVVMKDSFDLAEENS